MPNAVLYTMSCQVMTIVLNAASSPCCNRSIKVHSFKPECIVVIKQYYTKYARFLSLKVSVKISFRSCSFGRRSEVFKAVSKGQHKILLQYGVLHIFHISFRGGPGDAGVLVEQVEYRKLQF